MFPSSKAAFHKGSIRANDVLSFFKLPVAETRNAVRAAELMETTIELIRQMVYTQEKMFRNATGNQDSLYSFMYLKWRCFVIFIFYKTTNSQKEGSQVESVKFVQTMGASMN